MIDELLEIEPSLMKFALKLTRNQHDAEDLTQDTLLRAISKKHLYKEANLKKWAFAIMRNLFISKCRKQKPLYRPMPNPDDTDQSIMYSQALQIVNQLKSAFKVPFMMRFEGYSYKEISAALNIPIHTTKTRIFRARQQLKTKLVA